MTVRVAIDLALDRLFDYSVPSALEGKLAVGQLLLVPFGHREARGFAIAVGEDREKATAAENPRPYVLRPVTAIVDETPFFSTPLLDLVRRVAAYTASPIESVLKTALPAAVLRKNAHAREMLFVEPVPADVQTGAGAAEAVALTARQRWLYEQIVRLDGGWMPQLCRELKTTPASLGLLATKNLVTVAARAKRRRPLALRRIVPSSPLVLNPEQRAALDAVGRGGARSLLLFGVTGSGKTEVYLQAIAAELARGRGAIVMVPEISLTPQTVQRFASRFGDCVAVLHSALSDGERFDEWHRIRAGIARVVVGPRSAVWAPVRNLGLIVVDEEHETSYKQDEMPRYHARDVAVLRGSLEGARVVLGSATPSLESWMNVRRGKYELATMARRAGSGTLPTVHLVDMREQKDVAPQDEGGNGRRSGGIFSRELLDAIRVRLDRGEQTILFLNRRGYARSATCGRCGFVVSCPKCDLPYTYHKADSCLRCHVCGDWVPVPGKCPRCGNAAFDFVGIGTQRAELALRKCFPRSRVLRMDADSTSRKNSHEDILGAFRRGEADILVGTQMIAKGLDFPNVTLVGVLNADSSLNLPDFRAAERTYQLLAQVSGRAGLAELPGEVFVQTYDPAVPVLRSAAKGDYAGFAEAELASRRSWNYPPFCHLAIVRLKSEDLRTVSDWATLYAKSFANASKCFAGLVAGEAVPSVLEKADGWYRWEIVLRAPTVGPILRAWKWLVGVRPPPRTLRVSVDIDAF